MNIVENLEESIENKFMQDDKGKKKMKLTVGESIYILKRKDFNAYVEDQAIETILNELEKKDKIIQEVINYTNQEIEYYDEDIADYIDDDKNGNKSIIDNLKEDREHWKDILRIIEKVEE